MKQRNLVVGIYYHPEAYPPTLNALSELSGLFQSVDVVHRPHLQSKWNYETNITLHASGKEISAKQQEQSSLVKKIFFFSTFVIDLYRVCINKKPKVILLYDPMTIFVYTLIRPFLWFKHLTWYHNHDVMELQMLRSYSIGWFAYHAEKKFMKKLDLFTLPSNERLTYFSLENWKGTYFSIPNYPSIRFYNRFYQSKKIEDQVKLIFQGKVSASRGLEQMISVLPQKILDKELHLYIAGYCEAAYREVLLQLASEKGVSEQVHILGELPYKDIPTVSAACHIGISIYLSNDIMNTTSSMASNKMYEYAAVGLPVLYLDDEKFTKYLGQFNWAVPVKPDVESLQKAIEQIVNRYEELSGSANNDFKNTLNYETVFKKVKDFLSIQLKDIQ